MATTANAMEPNVVQKMSTLTKPPTWSRLVADVNSAAASMAPKIASSSSSTARPRSARTTCLPKTASANVVAPAIAKAFVASSTKNTVKSLGSIPCEAGIFTT